MTYTEKTAGHLAAGLLREYGDLVASARPYSYPLGLPSYGPAWGVEYELSGTGRKDVVLSEADESRLYDELEDIRTGLGY